MFMIIEEVSFWVWSEEVFGIWGEWVKIYGKGLESEKLFEKIRGDLWLVNIIYYDFIDSDVIWKVLLNQMVWNWEVEE